MSTKIFTDMRWHKDQRATTDTIMRHPADFESWKTFDKDHSWFASDARNVRLGLASDGFNPFNNLAKPYSIWLVIIVPYNLPPWSCMKDQFFMTSLLIPSPKSPGNDIDVYLQPLFDELVELWEHGVPTYDASTKATFTLHAALMWTINDIPAYGNLSGFSTKRKLACPSCNANTESNWLKFGRKQCYMGHRRFLPPDHIWRSRKGLFNGKEDHHIPPRVLSGSDVVSQLHMLRDVQFGKSRRKRKRTSEELNWTKISIFFKLPYWSTLLIWHNLDVMHIEKNICDNIFSTLMNIPGKTKDNINARRDLEILGMRKELHLRRAEVKLPDGFASNIARCVSVRDCKISGFKRHDCHVVLQCLLPIIQSDIVIILCKLEMIFPPSIFDVMVHLAIHLPREAILEGPVQYRWMYPFERYLGKFKQYVKNKTQPEGSIAEAYIHIECLAFFSMYLQDVETKLNRVDRNIDGGGEDTIDGFSIFNQHVRPLGISSNVELDDKLLSSARCEHYEKCKLHMPNSVDRQHKNEFSTWFKKRVQDQRIVNLQDVSTDLYTLACGPDLWVATYSACIINGKRFHSKQSEPWRWTQNSGVVVTSENLPNNIDFYGVINEILELCYMGGRHVYLFSCDWFEVGD
ncbi:uncharacterized protein LOC122312597 [Carya illinoinensis]|uniref:uncharacterized protein LOC122312597 n=1 Tax=Carya illinoinensis TaxID=32201 RepID=UPI001C72101E|nr:uncharacterized protein LOC122312597 [Carya illinoinensis]